MQLCVSSTKGERTPREGPPLWRGKFFFFFGIHLNRWKIAWSKTLPAQWPHQPSNDSAPNGPCMVITSQMEKHKQQPEPGRRMNGLQMTGVSIRSILKYTYTTYFQLMWAPRRLAFVWFLKYHTAMKYTAAAGSSSHWPRLPTFKQDILIQYEKSRPHNHGDWPFRKTKNCIDISGKKWLAHFRGNLNLSFVILLFFWPFAVQHLWCAVLHSRNSAFQQPPSGCQANRTDKKKKRRTCHQGVRADKLIPICGGFNERPDKGKTSRMPIICSASAKILKEQRPMAARDTRRGESKTSSSLNPVLSCIHSYGRAMCLFLFQGVSVLHEWMCVYAQMCVYQLESYKQKLLSTCFWWASICNADQLVTSNNSDFAFRFLPLPLYVSYVNHITTSPSNTRQLVVQCEQRRDLTTSCNVPKKKSL